MDAWQIVSSVVGILTIVLGVHWAQVKNLLKQVSEALTAVSDALEDNRITKREAKKIAREWGDVITVAAKIIKKK
jgi:hypothetical protein